MVTKIFADRNRLQITSLLVQEGIQDFSAIKKQMEMTDGNLSFHLRKLEKEGIVSLTKTFENNKPKTYVAITEEGHRMFMEYISYLEELILSLKGS